MKKQTTAPHKSEIAALHKGEIGGHKSAPVSRKGLPDVSSMFEDDGDPLEAVTYDDDDLEKSTGSEVSEALRQLKERRKALSDQYRVNSQQNYWLGICFQSNEQRDEFLAAVGWRVHFGRYVSGLEVARSLGIKVTVLRIKPRGIRGKAAKFKREEVI